MYERLKQLREEKGYSQSEFAKLLGMGQSTLAMMEVGKREILDRHVKTICSIFGINEEWFRYGTGEKFRNILSQLSAEYHLDDLDRRIIESYLQLGDMQRKAMKEYLKSLVSAFSAETASESAIDEEVESYRRELRQEKSGETYPVSQRPDENIG